MFSLVFPVVFPVLTGGGGTGGYGGAVDEKFRKLVREAKFSQAATSKLFSKFDRNNSGCITVGEFKRGFMEMGIQASTKDITDLIDRLDRDGNGTISYVEFVNAGKCRPPTAVDEEFGKSSEAWKIWKSR